MSRAQTDLAGFAPRALPGTEPIEGSAVRIEPFTDERRFDELYDGYTTDQSGRIFEFMAFGPFVDRESFRSFAARTYLGDTMRFHALVPASTGKASGVAALMRADPANGVIEIGHICLAPSLQQTVSSTEGLFLIMRRAFDLGYRRLEWKCDDRNLPSRRAAERFGFRYEGTFRQHMIVKGRNRDTAWFSIVDSEWPALQASFEAWLDPANFDAAGRQIRRLEDVRAAMAI
ncbi:GNAT family N-acetyltransferase [Aurantimonas aggregata]|uniref:GNAT family N-acetyltransferase n=1 Tax=Aurantimonas aggregata TaxID=2047720 RepID=A0A6L9MDG5_9HYPH|nr:GNAT family protein [Aurantimonas aggregata]NDV85873.1 GNAT family N-acetyltransferase [Aurantimonas aggregata]